MLLHLLQLIEWQLRKMKEKYVYIDLHAIIPLIYHTYTHTTHVHTYIHACMHTHIHTFIPHPSTIHTHLHHYTQYKHTCISYVDTNIVNIHSFPK